MAENEMIVSIDNLLPTRRGGITHFITHNSGYSIRFEFDSSWDEYTEKTAYFITNTKHKKGDAIPVQFSGNICSVPVLDNPGDVYVGITGGQTLSSKPLRIVVCDSIHDYIGTETDELEPSAYDRIMEILNRIINDGIAEKVSPATETEYGTVKVKTVSDNMIAEVGITNEGLLVAEAITEHDIMDLLISSDLIPATEDEYGILADDDGTIWIL